MSHEPNRETESFTLNSNSSNIFTAKITHPCFGKSAIFINKLSKDSLQTSRFKFGHISFGSNFPSFAKIRSAAVQEQNGISSSLQKKSQIFSGKNTASTNNNIPNVQNTIRTPKCYAKKADTQYPKYAVTLNEIDFSISNYNFGNLEWEVDRSLTTTLPNKSR